MLLIINFPEVYLLTKVNPLPLGSSWVPRVSALISLPYALAGRCCEGYDMPTSSCYRCAGLCVWAMDERSECVQGDLLSVESYKGPDMIFGCEERLKVKGKL